MLVKQIHNGFLNQLAITTKTLENKYQIQDSKENYIKYKLCLKRNKNKNLFNQLEQDKERNNNKKVSKPMYWG